MFSVPGIGNLVAGVPTTPGTQKLFLEISKEGKNALYPTEIAVTTGRSVGEVRRNKTRREKLLALQERLWEEVLAAYVWLFGVEHLQKVFDKAAPRLFKDGNRLSGDIAWNSPWRKNMHVDLSPSEAFTRDAADARQLLKIKGNRWFFSVGIAIALVAYVIPKLNQIKTNLLLKRFYGPPQNLQPAQSQPSTGIGGRTPITGAASLPIGTISTSPAQPAVPSTGSPAGAFVTNAPAIAQPALSGQLRFGGLFAPVIEGLGRLVNQTDYGSILVVDTGITGGRAGTARDLFEATEFVFRDVVSLFFYIMAAPLVMKMMAKVIDPLFKTHVQIEPKVAAEINDYLQRASCIPQGNSLAPRNVRLSELQQMIGGSDNNELLRPESWLKERMRSVLLGKPGTSDFEKLLRKEVAAYLPNQKSDELSQQLLGYLRSRTSKGKVDTRLIQQSIGAIMEGHAPFDKLTNSARRDLVSALKQTFRHTVGISGTQASQEIKKSLLGEEHKAEDAKPIEPQGTKVAGKVSQEEVGEITRRISALSKVDGMDQANTMLRRSLTVSHGRVSAKILARGEKLAALLDQATNRRLTLTQMLVEELAGIKDGLQKRNMDFVWPKDLSQINVTQLELLESHLEKAVSQAGFSTRSTRRMLTRLREFKPLLEDVPKTATLAALAEKNVFEEKLNRFMQSLSGALEQGPAEIKALVGHYSEQLQKVMGSEGRIFSLFIDDTNAEVTRKTREILVGGLQHDSAFMRRMLGIVGHFTPDSRQFNSPAKVTKMTDNIQQYCGRLLSEVESKAEDGLLKADVWPNVFERFLKLNRNLNYGSRIVALAAAMLGLGIFVPKMQYALTKRLTGKNENPGIGSALKAYQEKEAQNAAKNAPPVQASPVVYPDIPLNRNRFAAFQSQFTRTS
jgi:hypothetical protein